MRVLACMGGWCAKREQCANYAAPDDRSDPVERLCPPWADTPARIGETYEVPAGRYAEPVLLYRICAQPRGDCSPTDCEDRT